MISLEVAPAKSQRKRRDRRKAKAGEDEEGRWTENICVEVFEQRFPKMHRKWKRDTTSKRKKKTRTEAARWKILKIIEAIR